MRNRTCIKYLEIPDFWEIEPVWNILKLQIKMQSDGNSFAEMSSGTTLTRHFGMIDDRPNILKQICSENYYAIIYENAYKHNSST